MELKRLNKAISETGYCSRRAADKLIEEGKVKVNGTNVKPSYLLQREELVDVKKNGFDLQFKVIDIIFIKCNY